MLAPEILFHRYFQSPQIKAEWGYLGKQELSVLGHFGEIIGRVQQQLNDSYQIQSQRLLVDGKHPKFHFDYIEPDPDSKARKVLDNSDPFINAHAFYDGEYFFVGLTMPLVCRLAECAELLSRSPHIRNLFNIPIGKDHQEDLVRETALKSLFFGHQLSYSIGHELGHHACGHSIERENHFWTEFDHTADENNAIVSLKSQAYELQADGFAAQHLLTGLFKTDVRENSLTSLGRPISHQEAGNLLIGIFVVTVCSVLFALPNAPFETHSLYKKHPLKSARRSYMMSCMTEYFQKSEPDLVNRLTLEEFADFSEAVRLSLPPLYSDWTKETAFLRSESGSDYYRQLVEEVMILGAKPNRFRWVQANERF